MLKPPRVEYSLTTKGEDLMPIYYEMFKWSKKHLY
ncbi:MAG: winged helix-turn-helix transcriptional regulator [Lacrimispora sphenoides]